MKLAPLVLLTGCAQIFGLSSPKPSDAGGGSSDAPVSDAPTTDAIDAHLDLPDAAPGHCTTIADCPTSVCLPSTLCAADTDVAWLSSTGTANSACSMATPCNALNLALNTNRPYIRVHGTISNLISISRDVSIFGEPGAAFTNGNLQLNGGNVGVYELELANGCIDANAGTLTAQHIYVHNCTGVAINAAGVLNLDASRIENNRNGGLDLGTSTFTITNNEIAGNGLQGAAGSVGGIRVESTSVSPTSKIDFNTIVGNNIKSTSSAAGGLYCNAMGFTANGNVIASNLVNGATTATYANTAGACQHVSSVIQASINMLGFANVPTGDFHISATSSLRNAATVTGPATDYDGEPRPEGTAYDIGADEYHP